MEVRTESPLVVAVDCSTTASKALVVDAAGNTLARAAQKISLLTPAPGWYEQYPSEWASATTEAIAQALAQLTPADRARVQAICVTHQRESFALFAEDGEPLSNGILWLDERAEEEISELGSNAVRLLSGKPAGTAPSLYKIAWMKKHRGKELQAADRVSDVGGYLNFCLSGQWASSRSSADTLTLFDLKESDWSPLLLEMAGLRKEQLPRVAAPGSNVGTLRPELAQAWGLSPDVAIVAGGGDGQVAALGAGIMTEDSAYLNLGTAVVAGVPATQYEPGEAYRVYAAAQPHGYIQEVVQHSGAHLAAWFREEFWDPDGQGRPDPELDAKAGAIPVGSEGLLTLPYWNAVQSPHWDSTARGAIVGWRPLHTPAHMYRSLLEGISFELANNLEAVAAATGKPLKRIVAVGGGSRSDTWMQITADTLGIPLEKCGEEEVSALGAAVLAQAYLRNGEAAADTDIRDAAKAMSRTSRAVDPIPENHRRYLQLRDIHRGLYPSLRESFAQLSAFTAGS